MSSPTGTVSFLFTDIEGSTRLWERSPVEMDRALREHDSIIRRVSAAHGGRVFSTAGDSFAVAFSRSSAAVAAAVTAQLEQLHAPGLPLRVRMAVHAGESVERDGDYLGPTLNRAGRILGKAHGGQILVSGTAASLCTGLPADTELRDLGFHPLRDLDEPEHLFQAVHPELADSFPPLRTEARRTNLPHEHTSFVGRQQELAELDKLVAGARLVTVSGMGGVGKSRLVARLATDILDRFPDGVWHVQLAPLVEGSLVANRVASSLGVGSGERHGLDPLDEIAERLRDRTTLVILDDCERVIEGAATVAKTILAASRQTRVLSTSRESMGMAGEVIYRLSPLPVPTERLDPATMSRLDSVRLFLERAEAAQPGFRLTSETADGVARICRRLEGLPLALELAAARLRMVNLEELSSRVDGEAALLEPGRGSKTRQRTLLGVLDGSHELLTDLEQKVFRRIGLFMGGFRVDLAVEVCQVGTETRLSDILFDLVDRSLLAVDPDTHRFHMLEFVRLYAERRLRQDDSIDTVESLFAHRIATWLREAQSSDGGDQQWLAAIEAEQENIRRALNWLIGRGLTETAMGICAAMWRYWHLRGQPSEGRSWCERALAPADEVEASLTHRVLLALGDLAALQGDLDAGIFHLEAALEVAHGLDDEEAVAGTLSALAGLEHKRGNPDRAAELFEESLEISKRTGDSAQRIHVLASLALLTEDTGAATRADALGDEALAVARSCGDPYALADALLTAGELAVNRRDVDRAVSVLSEALEMAERTGLEEVRGWALTYLGQVSRLSADLEGALDLQRRGWAIFHDIDATAGRVWTLRQMALTEMDLGRFDEAAAHLRTALDLAHRSVKADVPLILEAVVRLQIERGALEVAARTAGAVLRWRRDLGLRPPPTTNDSLEGEISQVRNHLGDLWIVLTEEGATLELSDLAASI